MQRGGQLSGADQKALKDWYVYHRLHVIQMLIAVLSGKRLKRKDAGRRRRKQPNSYATRIVTVRLARTSIYAPPASAML